MTANKLGYAGLLHEKLLKFRVPERHESNGGFEGRVDWASDDKTTDMLITQFRDAVLKSNSNTVKTMLTALQDLADVCFFFFLNFLLLDSFFILYQILFRLKKISEILSKMYD